MTPLNALYVVLSIVAVALGGGLLLLLWQTAVLLATLKTSILPQVQAILTETQRTLVKVDDITGDVNGKLQKLDLTVDDAQSTVHAVAEATKFFGEGVARPMVVNLVAFGTGFRAALHRYRELRDHPEGVLADGAAPPRSETRTEAQPRVTELVRQRDDGK